MKIHNAFTVGLLGGLGVIVAVGIGATIGSLATIITYVGAAIFLALGIDPLVSWLEKREFLKNVGARRQLSILVVFIGILAVLAGLVLSIIPVIVDQVGKLVKTVPALIETLQSDALLTQIQDALPWLPVEQAVADAGKYLQTLDFASIGGGVLQAGIGIATGAFGGVIVVILMLYFVSSLSTIKRSMTRLVPASKRERVMYIADKVSDAVGRYVVGQVLLALVNGVLSFIFLTFIVKAEYSALLAFIAFIASLIPLVGTISGSVIITLTVLLLDGSPSWWVVGIYYIVYMQVEAYLLSPRIMNRAVKVPGVIVVIAALAGGTLLGVLGALVAIPVAASILIIIDEVVVPKQNEA